MRLPLRKYPSKPPATKKFKMFYLFHNANENMMAYIMQHHKQHRIGLS